MLNGLKVWWRGLRHLNHRGYIYVWGNLLWAVLSLPLITLPAAWAGLVKMSHEAHYTPTADIHTMWAGFKENLWRGAVLALLNFVVIGINFANLYAYREEAGILVSALRFVWLLVLAVWLTMQLYLFPLLYEMQQPTLWSALRNALVMVVLNPFFTIGLWLGILPIVILSTLVFPVAWALLTTAVLAVVANGAVIDRLRASGFKRDVTEEIS